MNVASKEKFARDGFVKGSRVLDDAQIDELRDEIERVIRDKDAGGRQPVRLANLGKPDAPVWQIVNIWEASEPFQRLVRRADIVRDVAQLTGATELRLWHDQIQYKPATVGGANMWHQDAPYWPIIRPMTQVTAWVALDDVDEGNGCMRMIPGSHRWGNQIDFLHTIKNFDDMPSEWNGHALEIKSCPVTRGEVHFHHALTWHGSGKNTSGRPRRAIALHYMTQESHFFDGSSHPMKQFVEVAEGEPLRGEHFPLVWEKKTDRAVQTD
jgi:ectoine hydroxylase-related dioxygenase (phytanoyl-CoA dioxygenase family)